jgi:adenine-specific DNA-methyltransferase
MAGHATPSQFYTLRTPGGISLDPPEGRCWLYTQKRMDEEIAAGNIWFGRDGRKVPRIKRFLKDTEDRGLTPETIWRAEEVGTNDSAKKGLTELFDGKVVFDTPKPEGLIQRVLEISTNPGDWVLDSFAGSGTTGAVAQKMGRRWIMVELGSHCESVILPRVKKVIDGQDLGGITQAVNWKGGGGFRYYRLAPSLLEKDAFANWVISKRYNAAMLAAAICKLEGFTYAPSEVIYWQHGQATENDFIYVTTQTLSRDHLARLSEEVGEKKSLLVMCSAFRARNIEAFSNLTIKKIPKAVLARCEWGKDDYSLEIKSLPAVVEPQANGSSPTSSSESRAERKARAKHAQTTLFATE